MYGEPKHASREFGRLVAQGSTDRTEIPTIYLNQILHGPVVLHNERIGIDLPGAPCRARFKRILEEDVRWVGTEPSNTGGAKSDWDRPVKKVDQIDCLRLFDGRGATTGEASFGSSALRLDDAPSTSCVTPHEVRAPAAPTNRAHDRRRGLPSERF